MLRFLEAEEVFARAANVSVAPTATTTNHSSRESQRVQQRARPGRRCKLFQKSHSIDMSSTTRRLNIRSTPIYRSVDEESASKLPTDLKQLRVRNILAISRL